MGVNRLWAGPIAALLLAVAVIGLPSMVPGYDQLHQAVSEIGEVGSPAQLPFTISLCVVALCLLLFASGLWRESRRMGRSASAAWLVVWMAVCAAGVGIFSYPHPLHNVFGPAELIGYQAPLALAWTWRKEPKVRSVVTVSWIMGVLVWVTIGLNLSVFDPQGALWAYERPIYGLVQRSLFVAWFGWCVMVGTILARGCSSQNEDSSALPIG